MSNVSRGKLLGDVEVEDFIEWVNEIHHWGAHGIWESMWGGCEGIYWLWPKWSENVFGCRAESWSGEYIVWPRMSWLHRRLPISYTLDNSTSPNHMVIASLGSDMQIPRRCLLVTCSICVNNTYHFYHCWPPRLIVYWLVHGNFTSLANEQSYLKPRKLPQLVGFVNQSLVPPCPSILSCVLCRSHCGSEFEGCFAFKLEALRRSMLDIIRQHHALRPQIFDGTVCVTLMIIIRGDDIKRL